ncbi:hypothetical protein NQ317_003462 [Molorchus minor]|uniref:ABC transmembrane type-1 domain-containing protein n=1 Tax=Molorchus minor TaxID=1323400 RepID=A0ABQ9K017_9CUCU|nr:hypothetical protein NQ317_003462 [Molorchus minor]
MKLLQITLPLDKKIRIPQSNMEETQYFDSNQLNGKDHPKERANIITKAFFCWFLPLFKELNEDDMYGTLKEHEASSLGDRLEQAWNYEVAHKKNPSLGMAIAKIFRVQLVLQAIFFTFRELVVKLSQPILITQFLKYYEPDQTEINKDEGHIRVYYAALIVTSTLLIVLCFHNYQLWAMHLGLKIRVAVCSLIYRKALKLNNKALAQTTVGQMVNLLSNDVGRFNQAVTHINFIWMAPLQLIIISYLLYVYVGIIGLVGTAFLLLFTPCQMYMGKKTSQYRLKTAIRTDERIRLMSEIINGIQVIKMYSWEKPFAKLVEISRRKEIQQIQKTSVIRAIIMSLGLILNRLAIYLCILVYVLTGHNT